jgi:hypothetical protein
VCNAQREVVAQICNLPYRRFVIGRASESSNALALADVQQNAILRYSRLQICATRSVRSLRNRSKIKKYSKMEVLQKFNLTANRKESIDYAVNRSLNNQLLLLGALLLCSVAVGL